MCMPYARTYLTTMTYVHSSKERVKRKEKKKKKVVVSNRIGWRDVTFNPDIFLWAVFARCRGSWYGGRVSAMGYEYDERGRVQKPKMNYNLRENRYCTATRSEIIKYHRAFGVNDCILRKSNKQTNDDDEKIRQILYIFNGISTY